MGNWNITIEGVGAHHNVDYEKDANRMAAEFVKKLQEAGHTIARASFTHGSADALTEPEKYLEERNAYEADEKKRRGG